jgi:hypothetical protein
MIIESPKMRSEMVEARKRLLFPATIRMFNQDRQTMASGKIGIDGVIPDMKFRRSGVIDSAQIVNIKDPAIFIYLNVGYAFGDLRLNTTSGLRGDTIQVIALRTT